MNVFEEDLSNIISEDLSWEKLRNTNILITGASGMIGRYLLYAINRLNEERDYNVGLFALVRNPGKLPEEIRNRISIIQQDVTKPIDTEVDFDYIIHSASPASPRIMRDDPVGTICANVLGTFNTLELARKGSGKGYLFVSSREIYGQPYDNQERFCEDIYGLVDPLNVRSCYPEGKKAAENMCVCYREQYGVNTKIARLAHTFGPGMSIDDGRVQADFLRDVINYQDITLKSRGEAVRTYTYVSDAVKAIFRILLDADEIVYNIASEESTVSIKDLAQTLVDAFPRRGLKLRFEIDESETNTGCAPFTLGVLDSSKIRGLGWKPSYSLEEGLVRTVRFLEE